MGDNVLDEMADALRAGRLPMVVQHDLRRRLDAVVLEAQVRDRSDGYKELWTRFLVDREQWATFEKERAHAGAPGGFSFSCSEPLAVLEPLDPLAPGTSVALAADASHWSDADLLGAAEELRVVGPVSVGRRYEFAHYPAAVVVLGVVGQIVLGVMANAVYDALKRLLRHDRSTVFNLQIQQDGRTIDARLETNDPGALRSAIDSLDQIVNPPRLLVWDEEEGIWKGIG